MCYSKAVPTFFLLHTFCYYSFTAAVLCIVIYLYNYSRDKKNLKPFFKKQVKVKNLLKQSFIFSSNKTKKSKVMYINLVVCGENYNKPALAKPGNPFSAKAPNPEDANRALSKVLLPMVAPAILGLTLATA